MIDIQDIVAVAEEVLAVGRTGDADDSVAAGGTGGAGDSAAAGGGLFLVEAKLLAGDEVELFIDSDAVREDGRPRGVSVEDCMALSRAIDARFDREVDDFSLTVSSAGIGQPLRVARQYKKLVGRQVEVVLTGGAKIVGTLEAAGSEGPEQGPKQGPGQGAGAMSDKGPKQGPKQGPEQGAGAMSDKGPEQGAGPESITVSYSEKRRVEGKKRPEVVTVTKTFPLSEVKTTREHIDFK
jgi:ribosome maturation factor RimP